SVPPSPPMLYFSTLNCCAIPARGQASAKARMSACGATPCLVMRPSAWMQTVHSRDVESRKRTCLYGYSGRRAARSTDALAGISEEGRRDQTERADLTDRSSRAKSPRADNARFLNDPGRPWRAESVLAAKAINQI